MLNHTLDALDTYPFALLRGLLDDVAPPEGVERTMLQIGEPQLPVPPMVGEAIAAASAGWTKYPPNDGTPVFRQTVKAWLDRRYGLPTDLIDPDRNVLPIPGTREPLFMLGHVAIPEKKNGQVPVVLMPTPCYHSYWAAALAHRAEPHYMAATPENRYLPTADSVDKALLDRAAIVYVCSPANPQGTVADVAYWKAWIEAAQAHDFLLVIDECYSEIYPDPSKPPTGGLEGAVAAGGGSVGGSLKNVVVMHSLSKRSGVPGLRSGFMAGCPDVIAHYKRLVGFACSPTPLPVLEAAVGLWSDEAHVEAARAVYRANIDVAETLLGHHPGFVRPEAGFFVWMEVGDGAAVARKLWAEHGIRLMPGAFMAKEDSAGRNPGAPFIRVALVHETAKAEQALTRLAEAL
ncbi:MAG: aminotransferase class I/II-fold pyridoxal phosphate-dependent enzyme [Alphaproteobacteria bacterium]|nr:aminotransferase class I/II-fold pyridoxal phosphate-dependent enzyme [Alphaproteobacteria bacterium]